MTIHEALQGPPKQIIMTVTFLFLLVQMVILFASFRDGRRYMVRLFLLLWFVLNFGILYLLMADVFWNLFYPDGSRQIFALAGAFRQLPLYVWILYEAINAIALLAALLELGWFRKNHHSPRSIKEAMDLLPAGIAFAGSAGKVVFSNLTMNRLSEIMTGKDLSDIATLYKYTAEDAGYDMSSGYAFGQIRQLTLPAGEAIWQAESRMMDVDGEPYIQLTAVDITEEAAIERELQEKNAKLRDIHMRLDIYNRHADGLVISQELLTARMAVHNEVGHVLLEIRHYLNDPASFDEELLLDVLRNTNTYLLKEYEEDDTVPDLMSEAVEMAEAIGVEVSIGGIIPSAEQTRSILAAAVIECATNTVKHAEGDMLSVDILREQGSLTYVLKGSGRAPEGDIHEGGGLSSLRALVENAGGTMQTAADVQFTVIITLPERKHYER